MEPTGPINRWVLECSLVAVLTSELLDDICSMTSFACEPAFATLRASMNHCAIFLMLLSWQYFLNARSSLTKAIGVEAVKTGFSGLTAPGPDC